MGTVKFNEQQQHSIDSNSKHIQIIASPGSGKSTVVVERIKRLIKEGSSPYEFLVITFTKKAAGSLKEKLAGFLTEKALNKMFFHNSSHNFRISETVIYQNVWERMRAFSQN